MRSVHEGNLAPSRRTRPAGRAAAWALLLALAAVAPAGAAIQTEHVVIVALDGERYSETLGDPTLAQCPRIGLDLATIGARPTEFRNMGWTITVPGMSAIVTAAYQYLANDGSERPHRPTLFEYLRAQQGTPDSLVRIVARKPKLDVLAHSDHPAYGAAYGAVAHVGYNSDVLAYEAARGELLHYRPRLMLVHLGDPDILGHANDWPGYLASIRVADSLVWRLWQDIQSDPVLAGRTTMLVTNDHGRHDAGHGGFQNHGDNCEGCRRILMVMAGPDNHADFLLPARYDQRSVARTAAWLLGVTMPLADADTQVMDGLLLEPSMPLATPDGGPAPSRLSLAVFPNPTQGGADVRLSGLPQGEASAEVLDASGRRVATLPSARAAAGQVTWRWSGADGAGRALAPGRYVVRVSAGGEVRHAALVKLH